MLDISDPPAEAVRSKALQGLSEAFDDHDYSRIARELARYERAEGAPLDALKHAFGQARDRLEYGITHAQAGAADWLALRERIEPAGGAERLVPVMVDHRLVSRIVSTRNAALRGNIAKKTEASAENQCW